MKNITIGLLCFAVLWTGRKETRTIRNDKGEPIVTKFSNKADWHPYAYFDTLKDCEKDGILKLPETKEPSIYRCLPNGVNP